MKSVWGVVHKMSPDASALHVPGSSDKKAKKVLRSRKTGKCITIV